MVSVERAVREGDAEEMAWVVAAQRDRAAFGPLYDRYARSVYRFCYRQLGDHDAAEDATSQTFLKALAGISGFQGGSWRAWLFTIADRVVTDAVRRRRPRAALDDALEIGDQADGPEAQVIADLSRATVQELIARLPGEQRRVVALRLAGLTGPEIALVIGISHGAVKSLQFRAYRRLRQQIGDREV